jgi:hypothetical protein
LLSSSIVVALVVYGSHYWVASAADTTSSGPSSPKF